MRFESLVHRFDCEQFAELIAALKGGSGNEQTLTDILNLLQTLGAKADANAQEIKDAIASIPTSSQEAIVQALDQRATALETLTQPKE